MQFSAIYSEVGNAFDSQSTARTKLWVNAAYHDILARRTWSFLQASKDVTLVASQGAYVIGGTSPVIPDFGGLVSISVNASTTSPGATTWGKLKYADQQMWSSLTQFSATTTGIPALYTISGGTPATSSATAVAGGAQQVELWPIPNAALTARMRYFRTADGIELSADTDVPLLPVHHHYTLILKATALGLLSEDQMLQANMYDQQAERRIQAMIADDEKLAMDNHKLTYADPPEIQNKVQATPAHYAPDQRTFPAPEVD